MTARRRNWLLMFVVLVFILVLRTFTGPALPDTAFFDTRQPQIIAHQGGNLLRPGDTLLAFAHAMSLGVDVLEMDVHTSADGEVVVIHDAMLNRTTNGDGAVNGHTLAQLKQLDAAYHWPFEGEERPYRGRGVKIPTLDEVLGRFPGMRFNIEIKQEEPAMGEALCAVLEARDAKSRTLIASFHRSAMLEFREVCPGVATSAFSGESTLFMVHQKLRLGRLYRPPAHALQLPSESSGFDLYAPEVIELALDRGMRFHAWTINDEATMRELFARGVSGIITDRPDLAMRVRDEFVRQESQAP